MFLCYSELSDKSYGKTAFSANICFWVFFPNDVNWELIFLMQESYVERHVLENLFNPQNLISAAKI